MVDPRKRSPHWIAEHRAFVGNYYITGNPAPIAGPRPAWDYCRAVTSHLCYSPFLVPLGHVASQTIERS